MAGIWTYVQLQNPCDSARPYCLQITAHVLSWKKFLPWKGTGENGMGSTLTRLEGYSRMIFYWDLNCSTLSVCGIFNSEKWKIGRTYVVLLEVLQFWEGISHGNLVCSILILPYYYSPWLLPVPSLFLLVANVFLWILSQRLRGSLRAKHCWRTHVLVWKCVLQLWNISLIWNKISLFAVSAASSHADVGSVTACGTKVARPPLFLPRFWSFSLLNL